jgi:hypothetical protein
MKAQGWAVKKNSDVWGAEFLAFGPTEELAWKMAERRWFEKRRWLKAFGYRCVPVTIEWRE